MSLDHISIFVADSSDVILAGFRALLAQHNIQKVQVANNGDDLPRKICDSKADIAFILWTLPGVNVRQIVKQIRTLSPDTRVMLMLQDEQEFAEAIYAEADGFIYRNTSEFVLPAAIECLLNVGSWIGPVIAKYLLKGEGRTLFRTPVALDNFIMRRLTPKERQIAQLLAAGWDNAAIGSYLTVTEDTVRVHIKNIGEKVGALGREAVRNRLLSKKRE